METLIISHNKNKSTATGRINIWHTSKMTNAFVDRLAAELEKIWAGKKWATERNPRGS